MMKSDKIKIKRPCRCSFKHTHQTYQEDFKTKPYKGNYKCDECGTIHVWDKN